MANVIQISSPEVQLEKRLGDNSWTHLDAVQIVCGVEPLETEEALREIYARIGPMPEGNSFKEAIRLLELWKIERPTQTTTKPSEFIIWMLGKITNIGYLSAGLQPSYLQNQTLHPYPTPFQIDFGYKIIDKINHNADMSTLEQTGKVPHRTTQKKTQQKSIHRISGRKHPLDKLIFDAKEACMAKNIDSTIYQNIWEQMKLLAMSNPIPPVLRFVERKGIEYSTDNGPRFYKKDALRKLLDPNARGKPTKAIIEKNKSLAPR